MVTESFVKPFRNKMQIAGAILGEHQDVTDEDKVVLRQWADDDRNFTENKAAQAEA